MPVDYHVHLEEGPYTFKWLTNTILSIEEFSIDSERVGSKEKIRSQINLLNQRIIYGCYSKEWLNLYLQKALKLGLKEVGIVDHLYRFRETRDYIEKFINVDRNDAIGKLQDCWLSNVMTEEISQFVKFIESSKRQWEEQGVQLKLGIEADFFPGGEKELEQLLEGHPWDFVIGSTHFVNGWGFDNPETIHSFDEWDIKDLYNTFFGTVENMIRSELFDFVAHLDNLKVFKYKAEDPVFNKDWYERIANALVETNTATEINAGLFYRYPVREMCPGPEFLQVLANKGVSFTLSSDSHFPSDLGKYVFHNQDVLKKLGIKNIATFNRREKIMKAV